MVLYRYILRYVDIKRFNILVLYLKIINYLFLFNTIKNEILYSGRNMINVAIVDNEEIARKNLRECLKLRSIR